VAAYSFLTTWCVESPIGPVWDLVYDAERWPEWWKGVESVVELEPGGEHKVGSLSRQVWRSRLPYRVRFESRTTRVVPERLIEGQADGELRGHGRWRFFESEGVTAVLYEWNVETTAAWMNLLAPIARTAFRRNHDWVMRQGGRGLARRLGVRLLASG
jgi:polyketide cyclase/dehydrase/lipid transport protein